MQVHINGQIREVDADVKLDRVLAMFELTGERIAVECNGRIISRDEFPTYTLSENEVVEIVRFVGGG